MGGWKLEVGKMFMYVAFPVGIFHYFNQPEYFEEYVIKMKREMYPKQDEQANQMLADCIKEIQLKKDQEMFGAIESKNE